MSDRSYPTPSITREAAAALVAAAREASLRIGFEPAIAVTDAAGNLRAFERTDRSSYLATGIAQDKAYTAAAFGLATHQWVDLLEDRGAAHLAHVPRVVAVAGGFPIVDDGTVIGGLGISGGSYAQDRQAGEEALRGQGYKA